DDGNRARGNCPVNEAVPVAHLTSHGDKNVSMFDVARIVLQTAYLRIARCAENFGTVEELLQGHEGKIIELWTGSFESNRDVSAGAHARSGRRVLLPGHSAAHDFQF